MKKHAIFFFAAVLSTVTQRRTGSVRRWEWTCKARRLSVCRCTATVIISTRRFSSSAQRAATVHRKLRIDEWWIDEWWIDESALFSVYYKHVVRGIGEAMAMQWLCNGYATRAKKGFMYREWTDNGPTIHRERPRVKLRIENWELRIEVDRPTGSKTSYLLVKNYPKLKKIN